MAAEYTSTTADVSTGGRTKMSGKEENLREGVRDYIARGKEKFIELEEGLEGAIQEHPIRSILIAAGVGAVVGFVLCRR